MNRYLAIELLTLSLLLVACGGEGLKPIQTAGLEFETSLNAAKLIAISDSSKERLIDVGRGNCPINEFKIPGEGVRARGGIGGLAVKPYPLGSTPGDVLPVSQHIESLAAPKFDQPSAILVVDDFNGQGLRVPGVYFPDQGGGDTLGGLSSRLPLDLNARTPQQEAELDTLEANGQVSHGALVFNHTLALLSVLDQDVNISTLRVDTPAPGVPFAFEPLDVILAEFTNLGILVAAVDTEDFDTTIIAGRIAATLRMLAAQGGVERFAVNLSFGLVPCSVLEDFQASKAQFPTFERYQEAVMKANNLDAAQFREELARVLTVPVGVDPLRILAQRDREKYGGAAAITYLAAAGNYQLDYALFPGHWPEFVSVSAENLSGPAGLKDADYSNTGEVLLSGGYYRLTFFDPISGAWTTYPDISVAGTSFAAPVLSVYTALDYSNNAPRCAPKPPQRVSPLAFFDTTPPMSTPLPKLDVPLAEAIKLYCP